MKPCPFCGMPAEIRTAHDRWVVGCTAEADCRGQSDLCPDGTNGWMSKELAVFAWDERAGFVTPSEEETPKRMSDGEMIARAIRESAQILCEIASARALNRVPQGFTDDILDRALREREASRQ